MAWCSVTLNHLNVMRSIPYLLVHGEISKKYQCFSAAMLSQIEDI